MKLIFNSEPPHTLLGQVSKLSNFIQFSHFFPLFALLQSSIERSIIISASQFTNFLSLQLGFKIVGSDREEDSYPLKLAPRFTKSRSRVWLPLIGKPRGEGGLKAARVRRVEYGRDYHPSKRDSRL